MPVATPAETTPFYVKLDADLARKSRLYAAGNGMDLRDLVSEALAEYLDRNADRMPVMPRR